MVYTIYVTCKTVHNITDGYSMTRLAYHQHFFFMFLRFNTEKFNRKLTL